MPHEDHVSYLGGLLTRHVDNRAEVESRISATMAVWKRMHMFFKNASCPVRWKLIIVYNSMIRSKLLYGLETVELTQSLLSRLESFQLRGLRKILNMHTTFIDRRNTNAEVYRRANAAAASRDNPSPKLTWCIEKCLHEKRVRLTGYVLRTDNRDPMRQVSFRRDSAVPYTPLFRRPGRPRKNWLVTSLDLCWKKNHESAYTNTPEQQCQLLPDARNRLF